MGALMLLLTFAGPAGAHVEVSSDTPSAGAVNAAVTFTAEAESTTAGITALTVKRVCAGNRQAGPLGRKPLGSALI